MTTEKELICNHCKHDAHCGHSCLDETCDHCPDCACDNCELDSELADIDPGYN